MKKWLLIVGCIISFASVSSDASARPPTEFKYTVETLYDRWKICVSISSADSSTLKLVELINDPYEDFFDKPPAGGSPGYVYQNVRFSSQDDPNNYGEIDLPAGHPSLCFTVLIIDPKSIAYAPIHIVSSHGNDKFIELTNKPLNIKAIVDRNVTHGFDTIYFPSPVLNSIGLQKDSCISMHFMTKVDPWYGYEGKTINSISLKKNDGNFKVSGTIPKLLSRTDSFDLRICCTAKDTAFHTDQVVVSIDCFDSVVFQVTNQGNTQVLRASDANFGTVLLGEKASRIVMLRNLGSFPFRVYKDIIIPNSQFKLSDSSLEVLPKILEVGDSLALTIDFLPIVQGNDYVSIEWNTDITPPLSSNTKSYSILSATGAKPQVHWNTDKLTILADSNSLQDSSRTIIYLRNRSILPCDVDTVSIMLDANSEFSITGNAFGYEPFEHFRLNAGDSIWVQITFMPDLTKPFTNRFSDRTAKLAASYFTDSKHTKGESVLIDLVGTFNKSLSIKSKSIESSQGIVYSQNGEIILRNTPESIYYSLYDLLGRKIKEWHTEEILEKDSAKILILPKILRGLYILKLQSGEAFKIFAD